jgi:hypothetical protein
MFWSIPAARHAYFVYNQSMGVENDANAAVSRIAAAIGEPAGTGLHVACVALFLFCPEWLIQREL